MRTRFAKSLGISLLFVGLVGCTVIPPIVHDIQPSYDGGIQNSGFLCFTNGAALITPRARQRYNGLIKIYGGKFIPPLTNDVGVVVYEEGKSYQIDLEYLVDFATMNRWRRQGIEAPVTPPVPQ